MFGNHLKHQLLFTNINLKSLTENVKNNFNNLRLMKQYLIELETNKNILNNEIQNQKTSIIKLEKEEEKKIILKI